MVTWAELNKQPIQTKTGSGWSAFNEQMKQQAIQQELKVSGIDTALYTQLRQRGLSQSDVSQTVREPEKVSFLKTLGQVAKETASGLGEQMLRDIRGISQVAATPLAFFGGMVEQGLKTQGSVTPLSASKESLQMAKDVLVNKNVSIDKGVEDAAQMWLKNRGVGKYGGKDPDIADVAAIGMLGFFNLFGDPAFEFAAGVPQAARALKEFATFKKVGQVTKELEKGTTILKGTGISREIKITDDLKVKIKPKTNEVVFEGYKKRFPTQKALPDNQMAKETQDLVINTREATGMELQAKFVGDDLVIKPTTPITKTVQPVVKEIDPLIQEAKKYKSAEQFAKILYQRTEPNSLYHGTDVQHTIDILKSGELRPSSAQLQKGETPAISFSRSRNAGIMNDWTAVKFVFDKEKIVNKFGKTKLIQEEGLAKEAEERLTKSLPINYIKRIEIPPTLNSITDIEKVNEIKKLAQQNGTEVREQSQLTDIWNKAQEKPVDKVEMKVEPEIKKSKLGLRVKEEAIEEGLVKQMRGLPEYETMNMKEQAKLASELINSDLEKAKRVAMGKEMPDGKLLPESVFIAMKNWAKQNKDVTFIRQLAKSHTVEEATFMGQRIRALGETDPNDPVKIIRDISQARAKKAKVTKKELTTEEKAIQREIKAVKKSEEDLNNFINSIIC